MTEHRSLNINADGMVTAIRPDANEMEPEKASDRDVEIERIAMSYHDRNGDSFDVPWSKTKSRYRTQVRKMVRNVLDCARLSCIEAEPGEVSAIVAALKEARRYVAYLAGDDRTFVGKGMPSECLQQIDAALSTIGGEAEPVAQEPTAWMDEWGELSYRKPTHGPVPLYARPQQGVAK